MVMKGLDELTRKMKELEKATAALNGEITGVSFDPNDPQSIELAIQKMEAEIDQRVGDYSNNEMIQRIVVEMKEQYRQAIFDRSASARLAVESEL
jgi:hypothetical protein